MLGLYFIALFVVGESLAQTVLLETCPAVETVQNFDVSAYMGTWYVQKSYFYLLSFQGKCTTKTYTLLDNGTIAFELNTTSLAGVVSTLTGTAEAENSTVEAKLTAHMPALPLITKGSEYILDTDYETYSTVWICLNSNDTRSVRLAWILTREREPCQETIDLGLESFYENDIDIDNYFFDMDQTNC